MASARPRDSARPRPTPVSLSRSPSRWNGRKTRSRSVSGMPGPWSMTRSSTRPPWSLAVTSGGRSAGLNRSALPMTLTRIRSSRPGSARDRRQVVGDAQADGTRPRAELVERPGHGLLDADRGRGDAERAGLQAAHVEQVGDQPGEPVERLVGGGQQLVAVVRRRTRPRRCAGWSTAALAEASGVRRSWLTAASSAVRIRSASASGRACGGLGGEPLLAQRDGGLGGERLDDAAVGGRERPPAQHQRQVVVDGDLGVALARARRRSRRRRWPRPARRPGRADGRAVRAASGGVPAGSPSPAPNVSRSRSSSAGSGRAPRSTLPATVARVCASALARAASRVRRAARSTTHADRDRDDHEHHAARACSPARRW